LLISGSSERRACVLIGINRALYRYTPEEAVDDGLRDSIKLLAEQHPKYGYRMIMLKLRQQDILVNHKRIERVYREEGLQLAKRHKRRKTSKAMRNAPEPATGLNEEWAMDFVSDTLHNGGRFRIFNLIDTYEWLCECRLDHRYRESQSLNFLMRLCSHTESLEEIGATTGRSSQARH
jgi:putative transposase